MRIIDHFIPEDNEKLMLEQPRKVIMDEVKETNSKINLLERKGKVKCKREGETEYRLRDTKNLVKNIYHLFMGWLEKHYSPSR